MEDHAIEPLAEVASNRLGAELQREYERRFDKQADYRNRVWQVLTADYLQRIVGREAAILDLGCGYGQFINNILAKKKFAMDLNPRARTSVASDVSFFEQDCAQMWPLEDGSLDIVFTSNFLEHLPDKEALRRTLGEARRCLSERGKIVCLGPNVRYLPGAYWDFWDHHIALSDRSLSEVLELSGFQVETKIPRFLPYTMAEGPPAPLFLIRWYLRLPVAWPALGRQFLIVAGASKIGS